MLWCGASSTSRTYSWGSGASPPQMCALGPPAYEAPTRMFVSRWPLTSELSSALAHTVGH
jgi:hypothetical protein